jgi:hypothetical protein
VTSAKYNGINGRLQTNAPYFEFNDQGDASMPVVFTFLDGSTHSVPISAKAGLISKCGNKQEFAQKTSFTSILYSSFKINFTLIFISYHRTQQMVKEN